MDSLLKIQPNGFRLCLAFDIKCEEESCETCYILKGYIESCKEKEEEEGEI